MEDVEERTEDAEERTEVVEEGTEDVEERTEDVEERTEDVECLRKAEFCGQILVERLTSLTGVDCLKYLWGESVVLALPMIEANFPQYPPKENT
jgi:hypothetical protein